MKVIMISCNSFDNRWTPDQLLKKYYTAVDWAKVLTEQGIDLHLFFRFHKNIVLERGGAHFHLIHDKLPQEISNKYLFSRYFRAIKFKLSKVKVDLIHIHNFEGAIGNILLTHLFKGRNIPILLQDHGSLPRLKMWLLQKIALRRINGFLFAAQGQEGPWIQKGLIPNKNQCFFVMESSSPFQYISRNIARQHSGWNGYPIFIWVGNLTQNKDPLTILDAFESALEIHPKSKLYMIYINSDLEKDIQLKLRSSSILQKAVTMIGSVERSSLELLYNSADYFLLGSAKEGSGFATIEAISCGVIPIVTNIPSYRAITENGRYGRLFNFGKKSELANILRSLDPKRIPMERTEVRAHFERKLSFSELAKQLTRVYEHLVENDSSTHMN